MSPRVTLTLAGKTTQAGVRVRLTINEGLQGLAMGDQFINANASLPVTAAYAAPAGKDVDATSTVVTWTAKFLSTLSVHDVRLNYYDGELTPLRLSVHLKRHIHALNWMSTELRKYSESYKAARNAVMLEYMKKRH